MGNKSLTAFVNVSESESLKDVPVRDQKKTVELVEDDFLFSLSTDDEDFDAEKTDKKYEKEKDKKSKKVKICRKQKAKYSKKSIQKRKKNTKNGDLSDDEGETLILDVEDEIQEEEVEEEEEKVELKEVDTQEPFPNIHWSLREVLGPSDRVRAENSVYNKSNLTGW